ncbi:uncharacterized protein LOC127807102 isoform X1 [Diospyros lotus]|uniref:uncharacterized protein LOC127807102 isoform X1 n=2 Tax=Diospyros lotus TaxID=55363 RepID=UPI0022599C9E|nr:uncharacterized protein LOC127807102 isoform X1 [Diospyros lotus]
MKIKKPLALCSVIASLLLLSHTTADYGGRSTRSSILFYTNGRFGLEFDIFTLPIQFDSTPNSGNEFQITDGRSINYNGHFPSMFSSSSILRNNQILTTNKDSPPPIHLIYVSERNGSSTIYLDAVYHGGRDRDRRRSALEVSNRVQVPLVGDQQSNGLISMKDRPSLVGDHLIYASTHENIGAPRMSWTAVYSTHLRTGLTRRLTPNGMTDFSPAVSPSETWTAVASYGDRGWSGEIQELRTDIFIFRTDDGSDRVKVVEQGGWPCWVDDSTLYFHRVSDDGWWSVYRAIFPKSGKISVDSVVTQRVTPPGLHAFTPATSPANKRLIAVATRRPDSEYRHIELFDVASKQFWEVTRPVSPQAHHYNPFLSPDFIRVGYHRCGGQRKGGKDTRLLLENLHSPLPEVSVFRIDGSFPSFSPEGDRIAFLDLQGLNVMNLDGSGRHRVYSGTLFGTAWDPVRKGVIYTSAGPYFAPVGNEVDVISINIDDDKLSHKKLTGGTENNAFPSPSPDGKWLVFRSGRSGYKNLYIMDAVNGEKGGLYRLTDGPWDDTMATWSPDGDWIAFSSDRENPGSGSFALYMIHPNGTGLKKLLDSGSGGRINHPCFSPDGNSIVFTSDYAALSAEPISIPSQMQAFGEIFTIRLDGSGLSRITHNPYEDGTPTWGPVSMRAADVQQAVDEECNFSDSSWLSAARPSAAVRGQCSGISARSQ